MADETTVAVPEKFKDIVEKVEKIVSSRAPSCQSHSKDIGEFSAAAVAVAGSGATAAAEEKTSFNVQLTDAGAQKVQVSRQLKTPLVLDSKSKGSRLMQLLLCSRKEEERDADKLKAAMRLQAAR